MYRRGNGGCRGCLEFSDSTGAGAGLDPGPSEIMPFPVLCYLPGQSPRWPTGVLETEIVPTLLSDETLWTICNPSLELKVGVR